jgi:predicted PurR-regulated permease PerM
VTRVQKLHVPRIAAVLLVVALASAALSGIGWVVGGQLAELADQLPTYRTNIRAKIADVRELTRGGTLGQVQKTIATINTDLERAAAPPERDKSDKPTLVEVAPPRSLFGDVENLWPVLETATTAGLALLLSIFMLINREDVRNRIVDLAGQAALVTTTKAFAEAGQRISRYFMQLLINAATGLVIGVGLYFIGVPYSALWGFTAALLRYVPYVGIWLAALFPIALSLITTPEWTQVAAVLGLFIAVELASSNVLSRGSTGRASGSRRSP